MRLCDPLALPPLQGLPDDTCGPSGSAANCPPVPFLVCPRMWPAAHTSSRHALRACSMLHSSPRLICMPTSSAPGQWPWLWPPISRDPSPRPRFRSSSPTAGTRIPCPPSGLSPPALRVHPQGSRLSEVLLARRPTARLQHSDAAGRRLAGRPGFRQLRTEHRTFR